MGAGLGIPLRQFKESTSPKNYAVLPADQIVSLRKDSFCDSKGQLTRNSIYDTGQNNASFDLHCGVIFPAGAAAYGPKSNSGVANGTVRNIANLIVYTVDDCIKACASFNSLAVSQDFESPKCQSITFITALQDAVENYNGNCFLKNATINDLSQAVPGTDTAISAEVHRLRANT